ncbi:MAG: CPBP family intramembrane metalloprotease [Planctomycetaceae bacterium]|nr:MAG: CPBP family intramembrane metalloprotease [Planctomycetaceae bacterium]
MSNLPSSDSLLPLGGDPEGDPEGRDRFADAAVSGQGVGKWSHPLRVWHLPLVLIVCVVAHQFGSLVGFALVGGVVAYQNGQMTEQLGISDDEGGLSDQLDRANDAAFGQIIIIASVVFGQLALGLVALGAAFLSPWSLPQRLGLTRGHWPLRLWFVAGLAAPSVGMLWSLILQNFVDDSESLKEMSEVFASIGSAGFAVPLAVLVGLMPGVCEELVFRGYLQTRLVKAWGPLAGLCVASVLFAGFHFDPVHVLGVLPLGFYFGWLAWSSGSIFPAMFAHFVNNLIGVLAITLLPRGETGELIENTEDLPVAVVMIIFSVVLTSFVCLVATIRQARQIGVDSRNAVP